MFIFSKVANICKHLWKINKVLNAWPIYFTPILGIVGWKKVTWLCNETVNW